jgi:hypothetical protein
MAAAGYVGVNGAGHHLQQIPYLEGLRALLKRLKLKRLPDCNQDRENEPAGAYGDRNP